MTPEALVVGVGLRPRSDAAALEALLATALDGLCWASVRAVGTLDGRAAAPALVAVATGLGWRVLSYPAARLAQLPAPNPSSTVAAAVGTPSVAEAAALLGAAELGATAARLVVAKLSGVGCTAAVAGWRLPG
ncbi:cobalamin biosynthesis protein [Pilimelia columellifera]|uniref:CobE/GbiG C-terminal domain-containing protein n=1 Tax=Pilimelia columellifera subsp. columellifera TaxID=706583 RepID=A0ABN3NML8_9ACTN